MRPLVRSGVRPLKAPPAAVVRSVRAGAEGLSGFTMLDCVSLLRHVLPGTLLPRYASFRLCPEAGIPSLWLAHREALWYRPCPSISVEIPQRTSDVSSLRFPNLERAASRTLALTRTGTHGGGEGR
jgi:hypothetical protein